MEKVLILDFGSQYTKLIARKVRELNVFSEIHPYSYSYEKLQEDSDIKAIILSGGPSSVYADDAPHCDSRIFDLDVPILGICYGLQHLAYSLNGKVVPAASREYGRAHVQITSETTLLKGLDETQVWMSHGDHLTQLPEGFEAVAKTENAPIAAIQHTSKQIYGIQFHPEVHHTIDGKKVLHNFLFAISKMKGDWSPQSFISSAIDTIRETVGDKRVLCGLSGGVDSSVAAVLIHKAIGDQLHCMFVDTGMMRHNEAEEVGNLFSQKLGLNLTFVTASDIFLSRLKDVADPEQKRKIIGKTFIDVFEEEARKLGTFHFLAQGTLYPDVIESVSFKGPSVTIKSHHNVGGLPERMDFALLEPFRELFKDEVRAVGRELGLPDKIIGRHPFPGPGLAVRMPGTITRPRLKILQKADKIYIDALKKADLYDKIWQAFCVLLPVQTVGVMGDERTYEYVAALRAVTSTDGMTADWYPLPYDFLADVSNRIINEVKGINRVVYDVSSKPPATIEWE
ncbi:MAG: glutamine-hydrolyzing GMP synthase [Calditrichia bacterium]